MQTQPRRFSGGAVAYPSFLLLSSRYMAEEAPAAHGPEHPPRPTHEQPPADAAQFEVGDHPVGAGDPEKIAEAQKNAHEHVAEKAANDDHPKAVNDNHGGHGGGGHHGGPPSGFLPKFGWAVDHPWQATKWGWGKLSVFFAVLWGIAKHVTKGAMETAKGGGGHAKKASKDDHAPKGGGGHGH